MVKEGDYIIIKGHRYMLGEKIGGGLEGSVFNLVSRERFDINGKFVVKIIKSTNLTDQQYRTVYARIRNLKELGESNKELRKRMSLPIEILGGDNLGYVMKNLADWESLKKYLDPGDQDFKEWYGKRYTLNRRYNLIAGIFETLREIHINGLIFTDLSPNNILVKITPNGYKVFFIDTDNLRARNDSYSGVLGTPGYIAPEIYRNEIPTQIGGHEATSNGVPVKDILSKVGKISVDSDIFSAAVIAFQMLTLHHPFVGDEIDAGSPEDEERAHRIQTDYIFKEGTSNRSTAHLVPAFEQLTTPEIRELFRRTFVDGIEEPALRPSDQEFHEAFLAAKDNMVVCPRCKFTTVYSKVGTLCLGCDEPLGPFPVLSINQSFYRAHPGSETVSEDESEDTECKKYPISRIVLTPGVEKNLCMRNFEKRSDRGATVASVKISDDGMVNMKLISDKFPEASIITLRTGRIKHFSKSMQEFSAKGHKIQFEECSRDGFDTPSRLEGDFSWE